MTIASGEPAAPGDGGREPASPAPGRRGAGGSGVSESVAPAKRTVIVWGLVVTIVLLALVWAWVVIPATSEP